MESINSGVVIDLEDAQAIAQNISEHLQYEEGADYSFWVNILTRLNASICCDDEAALSVTPTVAPSTV